MCLYWFICFFVFSDLKQISSTSVDYKYYPRYHVAPPFGWMNDPNGFSQYRHEYHLFYQHNPKSSLEAGIAHWGHVKSPDLVHWQHLPIAIYPNDWYDSVGAFSGSVLVENDTMYVMYTGNVNGSDWKRQRQLLAKSTDGINFQKYENNPVIYGEEHQPDFRDPKMWKKGNTYYAVLGNSFDNSTRGRVLLFESKDLISWREVSVIAESDGSLGYMWECPNFFEIDGKFVLFFSPQGLKPDGDKFRNLYQTGYLLGDFDYDTYKFNYSSNFKEIDAGHDLYAPQVLVEDTGRIIYIAWFDMWDQNYPEGLGGWTGQMTIPRVLSLSSDGRSLIQKPVKEIETVREKLLYSGKGYRVKPITLKEKSGEIIIVAPGNKNFDLFIESNCSTAVSISYNVKLGKVILNRGGNDGVRKTNWKPRGDLKWRLFLDRSSLELFCGEGEKTLSSRFFSDGPINIRVGNKSKTYKLEVYSLHRTIPKPK